MTVENAYIHPDADIADDVEVRSFAYIENNVTIDSGTWIGPHTSIFEGAHIGKNCQVFPGASIAAVPQDLKYEDEETTVEIGNNVIIREHVTVHKGTKDKYKTVVKDGAMLMAYVHVAHDCIVEENCILSNAVNLAGHVEIGEYAVLGGMTAVHQFVRIGKHAFISGGSLVGKDIPPYVKAARHPISYAGVNSVGLKRRDFNGEVIDRIRDIYRHVFVKDLNISQALEKIEANEPDSDQREEIVNFIQNSDRGIMRGYDANSAS